MEEEDCDVYFPEPLPRGLQFGAVFLEESEPGRPDVRHNTHLTLYQLGGGNTSSSCACGYFYKDGVKIKIPAGVTLRRVEDGVLSDDNQLKVGDDWFIIHFDWSYELWYNGVYNLSFPGIIDRKIV